MPKNIPQNIVNAINKLLTQLSKTIKIERVYLYGSYAKGTWIKTSDIDLIIVSKDFEGISFLKRLDLVNKIIWEARITPHIEVIPLTPSELEKKIKSSVVISDASKYWIKIR